VKLKTAFFAIALGLGSQAPFAHAEGDANSRALAVQLFDEAEALFAKGQVAQACPKYAESYRLDPQLGVLIYLAECYEKGGQLASAWGSYREAEEVAGKRGDPRGEHAHERAGALEPRLSYLVIQVPEAMRLPGLEVTRDGMSVAPVLWGARAAIDPGTHQIKAHAPGYQPWQAEVAVSAEGSSTNVDVPKLEGAPQEQAPESSTKARPADGAPGTSRRIAAIAVGGLGIVAIGAGGFLGLSAQSSFSDSKGLCGEQDYCTPRGKQLRESAQSKALVATIATGVGVAALVTAGVLWFTAPKLERQDAKAATSLRQKRAWAVAPSTRSWGLEVNGAF
jgi:hypothetical protein